jgi:hypothetical protein
MDWLKEARTATYTLPGFKFAEGGALDVRLHYWSFGSRPPQWCPHAAWDDRR